MHGIKNTKCLHDKTQLQDEVQLQDQLQNSTKEGGGRKGHGT